MRTARNFRIRRVVLSGSVAGVAVFAAVSAVHPERSTWAIPAAAHSAPSASRSALPSPPPRPSGAGGNLEVYVPPVPPPAVIQHLCSDLVSGTKPDPGGWLPDLVAITGGSVPATTSWCRHYLDIQQERYGRG